MVELQEPFGYEMRDYPTQYEIRQEMCLGGVSSVCSICGRLRVRKEGGAQHSSCSLGVYGEMGGHNWLDQPDIAITASKYHQALRMVKA